MFAFDTYKAVKALREAGFEEVQAEAVVAMVGDAMDEHVAGKTDIADLHSRLRGGIADLRNEIASLRSEMHGGIAGLRNEIAGLRSEMHGEIAGLRADMYRQLWFMGTGIVAVTVALMKLIP